MEFWDKVGIWLCVLNLAIFIYALWRFLKGGEQ